MAFTPCIAVAAIPGASSVEQLEHNAAAADIDLTDDQYQALADAAARFRPLTGPAVVTRLARSRFTGKADTAAG